MCFYNVLKYLLTKPRSAIHLPYVERLLECYIAIYTTVTYREM